MKLVSLVLYSLVFSAFLGLIASAPAVDSIYALSEIVRSGNVDMFLQFMKDKDYKDTSVVFSEQHKRLDYKYEVPVANFAAHEGQLEIMKIALENGSPLDAPAVIYQWIGPSFCCGGYWSLVQDIQFPTLLEYITMINQSIVTIDDQKKMMSAIGETSKLNEHWSRVAEDLIFAGLEDRNLNDDGFNLGLEKWKHWCGLLGRSADGLSKKQTFAGHIRTLYGVDEERKKKFVEAIAQSPPSYWWEGPWY